MAVDLSSFIWFKGKDSSEVFIYNPITGTKRLVNNSEKRLLKIANGGVDVVPAVLGQYDADQIHRI